MSDNTASQLAEQIRYSNELLSQIQELEESQLEMQREQHTKQVALRQALSVCDTLRADMVDVKNKLSKAQEVAADATSMARLHQTENLALKKQLEQGDTASIELKEILNKRKAECDDKDMKIRNLLVKQQDLLDQVQNLTLENDSQIAENRKINEKLKSELSEAHQAHDSLQAKESLQSARVGDLEKLVEQLKQDARKLGDSLAESTARESKFAEDQRRLHMLESQMKSELRNEQNRASKSLERIEALEAIAESRQVELEDIRLQLENAVHVQRELEQEKAEAEQELEMIRENLTEKVESHVEEKTRMEEKIRELRNELGELAREAREREQRIQDASKEKQTEHAEERKTLEDQVAAMQREQSRLNELLQQSHKEREQDTERYANVRREDAARLSGVQEMLGEAERKLAESDAAWHAKNAQLESELRKVRAAEAERSVTYVEGLTRVHGVVAQLASDYEELKNNYDSIKASADMSKAELAQYRRLDRNSFDDFHERVKGMVSGLVHANTVIRQEKEDIAEEKFAVELERDKERSTVVSLREDIARIKGELEFANKRLKENQDLGKQRLDQAKSEWEEVLAEKGETSRKLSMVVNQLEAANSQNRMLQDERTRANEKATESQTRLSERISSLEQQLADAEARLRKINQEKESLNASHTQMKKMVDESSDSAESLRKKLAALESMQEGKVERDKMLASTHDEQLRTANETSRQYYAQLTQTKNLLKVIQDQRKKLLEDNQELRAELDSVLKQSVSEGSPRPKRVSESPPPAPQSSENLSPML